MDHILEQNDFEQIEFYLKLEKKKGGKKEEEEREKREKEEAYVTQDFPTPPSPRTTIRSVGMAAPFFKREKKEVVAAGGNKKRFVGCVQTAR